MDIISEQVYLPSYKNGGKRRTLAIGAGLAVLLYALERQSGAVSRTWSAITRGLSAAVAAVLEESGGIRLFTREGDEPPVFDFSTVFKLPPTIGAPFDPDADLAAEAPRRRPGNGGLHGGDAQPSVGSKASESSADGRSYDAESRATGPSAAKEIDVPQFLLSTKFFACLELEESTRLCEATTTLTLEPHSLLFRSGDSGSSGIFIVVDGSIGVFLPEGDGEGLIQTNTLLAGESVGDLDVIDGARRSVTCMALEEGAVLVQLSRALFLKFISENPLALQIYLQQAIARLWRVAYFVLHDYLNLPLTPSVIHRVPSGEDVATASVFSPSARSLAFPEWPEGLPRATHPASNAQVSQLDSILWTAQNAQNRARVTASENAFFAKTVSAGPLMHSGVSDASNASLAMPAWGDNAAAPPPEQRAQGGAGPSTATQSAGVPVHRSSGARAAEQPAIDPPPPAPVTAAISVFDTTEQPPSSQDSSFQRPADSAAAADGSDPSDPAAARSWSLQAASSTSTETPAASALAPDEASQHAVTTAPSTSSDPANVCREPEGPGHGAQTPGRGAVDVGGSPASSTPRRGRVAVHSSPGDLGASAVSPRSSMAMRQPLGFANGLSLNGEKASIGGNMVYTRHSSNNSGMLHAIKPLTYGRNTAMSTSGWDIVAPMEANLSPTTMDVLATNTTEFVTMVLPNAPTKACCRTISATQGTVLVSQGKSTGQMIILSEGEALVERIERGVKQTAIVRAGSLLGGAAFITCTHSRDKIVAISPCKVRAIGPAELENLRTKTPGAFLEILLAASKALGYFIRRFISLGLNRVWLRAGNVAYHQGVAAESLFVVISGRIRLMHQHGKRPTPDAVRVEEEVGRGETIGAVWAVSGGKHDTTAIAVRDSELVRMSRSAFEVISSTAPKAAARVLTDMANRLASSHASRTRTSKYERKAGSWSPDARPAKGVAGKAGRQQRMRGDIVTIAIMAAGSDRGAPAGDSSASNQRPGGADGVDVGGARSVSESMGSPAGSSQLPPPPSPAARNSSGAFAVRRLSAALKQALVDSEGPCLTLSVRSMAMLFPKAARRLHVPFYRTKVTSWMASQEEDYRFILLEADDESDMHWTSLCADQADCILLVAHEGANPEVSEREFQVVWKNMMSDGTVAPAAGRESFDGSKLCNIDAATSGAKFAAGEGVAWSKDVNPDDAEEVSVGAQGTKWARVLRRVELVVLQKDNNPSGTLRWLTPRPLLARYHHVRLNNPADLGRVRRWMAGKAVGLVMSGGGSRGLAHLGVLQALDDMELPIDVVGGTSQGAFMAALYAQGLPREAILKKVREYAAVMSSPRHLLSDLTLPILSVFSGRKFDQLLKETFADGPREIEDLWLSFFCMSTNLSKARPEVHQSGSLWQCVRASMTIVGMIPPVIKDGDMLVDGGYLNNLPVDAMRALGVETVIVVDVEDKQSTAWHNLTPYDGGVSGWRLLWDRVCPVPGWRFGIHVPRYRELVNALSWMSHSTNLRRMLQDHHVDLYLRPPYIGSYKLMDYHLYHRIVRDSYRYAWGAISEWVDRMGGVIEAARVTPSVRHSVDLGRSMPSGSRRHAITCMPQLQSKRPPPPDDRQEQDRAGMGWLVSPVPTVGGASETAPTSIVHVNPPPKTDSDKAIGETLGNELYFLGFMHHTRAEPSPGAPSSADRRAPPPPAERRRPVAPPRAGEPAQYSQSDLMRFVASQQAGEAREAAGNDTIRASSPGQQEVRRHEDGVAPPLPPGTPEQAPTRVDAAMSAQHAAVTDAREQSDAGRPVDESANPSASASDGDGDAADATPASVAPSDAAAPADGHAGSGGAELASTETQTSPLKSGGGGGGGGLPRTKSHGALKGGSDRDLASLVNAADGSASENEDSAEQAAQLFRQRSRGSLLARSSLTACTLATIAETFAEASGGSATEPSSRSGSGSGEMALLGDAVPP